MTSRLSQRRLSGLIVVLWRIAIIGRRLYSFSWLAIGAIY
jgi:hypothetical protein